MKRSQPSKPERSADSRSPDETTAMAQHGRKRAPRVCFNCHERKIKCDLILKGFPCSSCAGINAQCIERQRKNARSSRRIQGHGTLDNQRSSLDLQQQSQHQQPGLPQRDEVSGNASGHYLSPPTTTWNVGNGNFGSETFDGSIQSNLSGWSNLNANVENQQTANGANAGQNDNFLWSGIDDFMIDPDYVGLAGLEDAFNVDGSVQPGMISSIQDNNLNLAPITQEASTSDRSSSPTLRFIPPRPEAPPDYSWDPSGYGITDHKYLESQGCFSLPRSSTLHQLMRAYFQFVHPNIPLISETEVWSLWPSNSEQGFHLSTFPILVVQAMIFATIGVVSDDLVSLCGFSNRRIVRAMFYKRAKLLYDFQFETNPIHLSQAAILLTYHSPKWGRLRFNSQWLMNGILYARIARADRFYELSDDEAVLRRTLKRLWWCCILRDRVMPLGVRRPIQIFSTPPIPTSTRYLNSEDFTDELSKSLVHDEATQHHIYQVLNSACRLAEALTPVLNSLYPREGLRYQTKMSAESLSKQIQESHTNRELLYKWHEQAVDDFPSPISLGETSDAVIVFGNLLFIYFNAAIIALSNHETFLKETSGVPKNPEKFESVIFDITNAVNDTTNRAKELLQLNLGRYAPISITAFLALPLLLHALNVKAAVNTRAERGERRQLEIYSKLMHVQQQAYDGCDFVFEVMDNILAYVGKEGDANGNIPSTTTSAPGSRHQYSIDPQTIPPLGQQLETHCSSALDKRSVPQSSPSYDSADVGDRDNHEKASATPPTSMAGWKDLIRTKPRLYLRLVLHVDVALREAIPPRNEDFPMQLRRHTAA